MKKQGVFMAEMDAGSTAVTIDIVGVIGWEVAFTELRQMFGALPDAVKRVTFNIYSPGGDVWDGNGIVQAIGDLGKTRETVARVQVAATRTVGCQPPGAHRSPRILEAVRSHRPAAGSVLCRCADPWPGGPKACAVY